MNANTTLYLGDTVYIATGEGYTVLSSEGSGDWLCQAKSGENRLVSWRQIRSVEQRIPVGTDLPDAVEKEETTDKSKTTNMSDSQDIVDKTNIADSQ